MKFTVYNTHMELHPYNKGDYPEIEEIYTAVDPFTMDFIPCGYIIENKTLFLPRGTPIHYVEKATKTRASISRKSDPQEDMHVKHYPTVEPRDELQEETINFLLQPDHQLSVNLVTGFGKSFVVAYSIMMLNKRAIIITPDDGLKHQWIKTFEEMMDVSSDDILDISSSDTMKAILNGELNVDNVDVFFVNHQTLRSFFVRYGPMAFKTFFRKIKVGIKVYDEAHKEFHNILLIDAYTNTDRTWYITATFDRSDKTESKCFRTAFNSVIQFGGEESRKVSPPHTIYHVVNVNSQISVQNRKKVMGWNGMTGASYGRYAFENNPKDTVTKTIIELIEKLEGMEGKILVLVPLIDAVDSVAAKLQERFPDKIVSVYHSKVPKEEKADAFDADIIVSTLKSCGTGKDIKGLRTVINTEALASKVNAEQMIGRLRPYKDKNGKQLDTLFFDIVDVCIPPVVWWWKARFKRIKDIVKKVVHLDR